jgi:hypothetical protein
MLMNLDFEVLRELVTEMPAVNGRGKLHGYMELIPFWTLRQIIGQRSDTYAWFKWPKVFQFLF